MKEESCQSCLELDWMSLWVILQANKWLLNNLYLICLCGDKDLDGEQLALEEGRLRSGLIWVPAIVLEGLVHYLWGVILEVWANAQSSSSSGMRTILKADIWSAEHNENCIHN